MVEPTLTRGVAHHDKLLLMIYMFFMQMILKVTTDYNILMPNKAENGCRLRVKVLFLEDSLSSFPTSNNVSMIIFKATRWHNW